MKDKFLHRHGRQLNYRSYYDNYNFIKHRKKFKNLVIDDDMDDDFFDKLYKYLPNKPKEHYYKFSYIDTTPLIKFLESKIGQDWNEVYSEILSKTKKKYRFEIINTLEWAVKIPIYDENYLPRDNRGKLLRDRLIISIDNKLVKMTEDDARKEANKYLRRDKMRKLMESIENESNDGNLIQEENQLSS